MSTVWEGFCIFSFFLFFLFSPGVLSGPLCFLGGRSLGTDTALPHKCKVQRDFPPPNTREHGCEDGCHCNAQTFATSLMRSLLQHCSPVQWSQIFTLYWTYHVKFFFSLLLGIFNWFGDDACNSWRGCRAGWGVGGDS